MKYSIIVALLLAVVALAQAAQYPCSADSSLKRFSDTDWTDGEFNFTIYYLHVKNTGSQSINLYRAQIFTPPGGISEAWGLENVGPFVYELREFGGSIEVGQTYSSAGFVLKFIGSPLFELNPVFINCTKPEGSSDPTSTPTSTPTSSPTSFPTSTPSSAPTSEPTEAPPQDCEAVATLVQGAPEDSTWNDGQSDYIIYSLDIHNVGLSDLKTVKLLFSIPSGAEIVNFWNLNNLGNSIWELTNFGGIIDAGTTNGSAGFVLKLAPGQQESAAVTVHTYQC